MTTDLPTLPLDADEPLPTEQPPAAPVLRARTRWAGIVWGAVLGAVAFAALWILGSAQRRDDVADWLETLTVPAIVGASVLVLGVLLLLTGLVGLLRRAQKALGAERDA